MSNPSLQSLLLATPLPPQLLRLNQPFSLEIPSHTFIDPSHSLSINASLSDGSPLPSWLTFNSVTRKLSGTPPLMGQLNVRFTATANNGKTITDTVALSITRGEATLLFNNTFGYGHSISVVSNRAYLATGHTGLAIYDLSQPSQPVLLGTYDSPGYARDVAISGNYAYLADSASGLAVINISNPSSPTLVSTFTWPGFIEANALTISGNYLYVASWGEGLKVFDITAPEQPTLAGSVDTPGTAVNVAVFGNYAYIADFDRITIINISNPLAPSQQGSYIGSYGFINGTFNSVYSIAVAGSHAFVVGTTGLEILSLANPLAPTQLSFYNFPNPEDTYWLKEPTVIDNKLYMSTMNSGIHILDISDLTTPKLLAVYPTDDSNDLAIAGESIYVADKDKLRVIDRINIDATPANTEPLLGVPLNGLTAYQNQPFLFKIPDQSFVDPGDILSFSVALADGSPLPAWLSFNPSTRTLSGSPTIGENFTITIKAVDQTGLEVSDSFLLSVVASKLNAFATTDLLISGTNAFFANGGNLGVADISNPLQMNQIASLNLPGSQIETMILRGNYIYMAKPYIGLQIVDVSQPGQPNLKGTYSSSGYATSVASWGNYILLGETFGKISIIDVSNPAAPTLASSFQLNGDPYSIQSKDNLVLISYRNFEGFGIYSLSNSLSPTLLSQVSVGSFSDNYYIGTANDFKIIGDLVYLAGSSGFLILNISDPSNPTKVGSVDLPDSFQRSLQIINNIALVTGPNFGADKGSDVQAIDISNPSMPRLISAYEIPGANYGISASGNYLFVGGTNGLSAIPIPAQLSNNGPASFSISGTPAVGNTLSAANSSPDPDGNGAFTYTWQSSTNGSSWSPVGGNSATYLVTSGDQGKQLRLLVSYTDGEGFSESITTAVGSVPILPPPTSSAITVSPTSGLITTENGGTASFSVLLNSQPTANVIIGLSSSEPSEGTVSISALTFTTTNWNTPQIVTVTGFNDFVDDGDIIYSILTAPAVSSDASYNNIDTVDVSITNTDNDTAGINISPTSGLSTTEAGGTASFSVQLNSQPTGDVIIGLTSSDPIEGTLSISSLTFTAQNWNISQTVTVNGTDDAIIDGNIAYSILTAPAVSTDANYNGLNSFDVMLTNIDNDRSGSRPIPPLIGGPQLLPGLPGNPILERPIFSG